MTQNKSQLKKWCKKDIISPLLDYIRRINIIDDWIFILSFDIQQHFLTYLKLNKLLTDKIYLKLDTLVPNIDKIMIH